MTPFLASKIMQRLTLNSWTLLVLAIALIIATPILFVFSSVFTESGAIWEHLASTVLKDYIINTCWLMLLVGTGVCLTGVAREQQQHSWQLFSWYLS